MVSLAVSKVDRLECAYLVYPILPAIPSQSQIIWECGDRLVPTPGIQLQAEEFDLMAAAVDLDEIEEVNANCILMANLQQSSTSFQYGTKIEEGTVEQNSAIIEEHRAYFESLKVINLAVRLRSST
ncbi:hypothetical protein Tco_0270729 [Tanacetum coccineum]